MVVVQGLLNLVLLKVTRHTINTPEIIMGSVLGCIFIFSLSPIRRLQFELFLLLHPLLALTYAAALIWNLAPQSVLYPIIALSVWLLHTLHRLFGVFYRRKVNGAFISNVQGRLRLPKGRRRSSSALFNVQDITSNTNS
jgi:hypothetical protein